MATTGTGIDFQGGGEFYGEMKSRVRAYLADPKRVRRGERQILTKTVIIATWMIASWVGLMFWASNWWQAGLLSVSAGLALAGLGFNVTHDANHGSYSRRRWLNHMMRWSLDVIGGSSYVWRTKHNVVHHTYTNIAGADSDIDSLPFARFAPDQQVRPFHRFQHFYMWGLYGLFAIKWHTTGDFDYLLKGKIGETPIRWPKGRELVGFVAGKLVFVSWTVIIPLLLRPALPVVACFLVASFVLAFTLSITFQLAHCLEEAEFSSVERMQATDERTEWARHQVETTVDFAPKSRILAWYMGGLNFQIEHHLFTKVCHVHYPHIASIVRDVCQKHGVDYQAHPSLWSAVASHARWLRKMGRPELQTTPIGAS